MPLPLHVLILEDNPDDAELLVRELRRAGYDPDWCRVDTEAAYLARLNSRLDLVLSDYEVPAFSGLRALKLLRQGGWEVPFIIVSGAIGEDTAVAAMKLGAADYLLKDRLTRLGPAVSHVLEETRQRRERKDAAAALARHREINREQDRTHIAREIHDVLAQELTQLKIDLVWLAKRLSGPVDEARRPDLVSRLRDAITQTDTAITTVQRIATELRPVILDSLGLPAAVEWLAEDFARRTGVACTASAPGGDSILGRERATALFRILQESLTNIARHAQATAVSVGLTEQDGVSTLMVRDNGRGISGDQLADPRSIGLLGMRERADAFGGTLDIKGAAGAGTTITVRIPADGPDTPLPP